MPVAHWQTEMESVYMQLDNSLERLVTGIEKQIGLDKVLIVVTSTGYTDESVADLTKYHIPTGTFYINPVSYTHLDVYKRQVHRREWIARPIVDQSFVHNSS